MVLTNVNINVNCIYRYRKEKSEGIFASDTSMLTGLAVYFGFAAYFITVIPATRTHLDDITTDFTSDLWPVPWGMVVIHFILAFLLITGTSAEIFGWDSIAAIFAFDYNTHQ
jgi:hypothetical protein